LSWPLPEGLSDEEIARKLLNGNCAAPLAEPARPLPDWAEVHKELGRRSVTLRLLWQEYRQRFPNGYAYTQFCEYYHRWAQTLETVYLYNTRRAHTSLKYQTPETVHRCSMMEEAQKQKGRRTANNLQIQKD